MQSFNNELKERFIPAYAGNSYLGLIEIALTPVHPRLRGELLGILSRD